MFYYFANLSEVAVSSLRHGLVAVSRFKRKNQKNNNRRNLRYMRTESRVLMLLMFSDVERDLMRLMLERPGARDTCFSCGTRFSCSTHRPVDATLKSV